MVGCFYMLITMASMWHHYAFKTNKSMMNFILILDIILCIVMTGFTLWNWGLIIVGKTTIELWSDNFSSEDGDHIKLSFDTVSDNMYRVFGTHKMFRVLSPSLRNVPFTGLEWSFWYKDSGYDVDGLKRIPSNRPDLEMETLIR